MALFCNLDYAGLCCKAHFSPKSPRTRFGAFCPLLPFLLHLIVKTGFMSLKYFLNRHHFSSISRAFLGDCQWMLGTSSKKRWTFLKKSRTFLQKRGRFSKFRWTFSKKRRSFFQSPPREDFSQQIGTQKSRKWKSYKLRSSIFKY